MDSEYGRGSNGEHSRASGKATGNKDDVLASPNSLSDSEHERENIRHPRRDLETTGSIVTVSPTNKLNSLFSGSSSSDSSLGDFIQVISKSRESDTASPNDVQPLSRYYKTDLSSNISYKSEYDSGSATWVSSKAYNSTHESPSHCILLTESPPIQVMERPSDCDLNRIPSFVFESKSPEPSEWSVVSNESLFSIHIGNDSFPRDPAFVFNGEFYESGELYKSVELYKSSELISLSPSPPAVQGRDIHRDNVNERGNFGETGIAVDKTMKDDASMGTAKPQSEENLPSPELAFNHHLDASGTSTQSIAFPKKKKHARSSCYCSNCSCLFCCCTLPSCCYCKWPSCKKTSCSCSMWPSCSSCCCCCCGWNSRRKRIFSSSSKIMMEEVPMQLHSEPKVTPKTASIKWFSCFCCSNSCC